MQINFPTLLCVSVKIEGILKYVETWLFKEQFFGNALNRSGAQDESRPWVSALRGYLFLTMLKVFLLKIV